MKISQWLQVAVLTTASFFTFNTLSPTTASTFDNQEVTSDNFIAVAAPFGENKYQLLIIEQLSNQRACWSESGSNPVMVEPLLLNFDFTGICGRSTDSNGYSIRVDDQDFGLDYILRLVERNGELVLVGTHRINRNAPEIEIGRTRGMGNGFQKIFLDPDWRFTRRTYQGKTLGHIYLTGDSSSVAVQESNPTPRPLPPTPAATEPLPSAPPRELIFTRPDVESTPLSTPPSVVVPTTPPGTLPPPSVPEREIPVLGN